MVIPTSDAAAAPRRRGRPRRIDRARIVEVARTLDPEALTMRAVADALGVDPKALNYHVTDRESLRRLVAADAFHTGVAATDVSVGRDWRQALRVFATVSRDSIIATGALASYFRFDNDSGAVALGPAEVTLELLLDAGFDPTTTGRILAFVSEFVLTSAQNAITTKSNGDHPQNPELRRALEAADGDEYRALRRVFESGADQFGRAQFEFNLQVLILGLDRLLEDAT